MGIYLSSSQQNMEEAYFQRESRAKRKLKRLKRRIRTPRLDFKDPALRFKHKKVLSESRRIFVSWKSSSRQSWRQKPLPAKVKELSPRQTARSSWRKTRQASALKHRIVKPESRTRIHAHTYTHPKSHETQKIKIIIQSSCQRSSHFYCKHLESRALTAQPRVCLGVLMNTSIARAPY